LIKIFWHFLSVGFVTVASFRIDRLALFSFYFHCCCQLLVLGVVAFVMGKVVNVVVLFWFSLDYIMCGLAARL
jgi:hypothetical protein